MGVQHNDRVEWWQDKTVEKMRGRFFGSYLGIVKDREDPKKLGRVRIHCSALLPGNENQESTWLPWALPKGGSINVPPLNSPVLVTFEQGQIQHAIYEWGWLRGVDENSSEAPLAGKEKNDPTWKKEDTKNAAGSGPDFGATIPEDTAKTTIPVYGFNKVFESEGGHILELDDSGAPRARYRHPSGTSILIDPDGSVHIRSAGAILNEPRGDYVVNLRAGSTFKVVYDGGSSIVIGPSGIYLKAHATSIMSRIVRNNREAI